MTLTDPVYINDVNLNDLTGVTLIGVRNYRQADRSNSYRDLTYDNLSVNTSAFDRNRKINIVLSVARQGRELLDETLDEVNLIVRKRNVSIKTLIKDTLHEFRLCSFDNMSVADVKGGYAQLEIEYTAVNPYYYELSTTELLDESNVTSGNKSYPITVAGTASQQAILVYTLDSFTDGSNKSVTFTNPDTEAEITIQRDWTAAEVLTINAEEKTVDVDGTAIDFEGNFLEWSNGAGFINYTDNFTERQFDLNVTYYKRFI